MKKLRLDKLGKNLMPVQKHFRKYAELYLIVLGLLVGFWISSSFIPQPIIALVHLETSMGENNVDEIVNTLRALKDNRTIQAVVLSINSPGGEASSVEEIYLTLVELREKKPVVVNIGNLAASGAYYISAGANYIFAKPSSNVGGIGVISVLPERSKDKQKFTTGPLKQTGITEKEYSYQIDQAFQAFVNTVMINRGSTLKLAREEIAQAKIYTGAEALRNGLIDQIGSETDALDRAALLAGVFNYKVQQYGLTPGNVFVIRLSSNETATNTVPLNYFLYVSE